MYASRLAVKPQSRRRSMRPADRPILQWNSRSALRRGDHWKVMSRHLVMSEPSPDEMVMQPRTFCCVVSAAQIE